MLLCKTDPDFKSELFEKVKIDIKAACNVKFAVSKYYLPLPLLLLNNSTEKRLLYYKATKETIAISAYILVYTYNKINNLLNNISIKLRV